jgi:hypothetical protein
VALAPTSPARAKRLENDEFRNEPAKLEMFDGLNPHHSPDESRRQKKGECHRSKLVH